jgi:iron complex outermembrane recepter protein
MFGAALATAQDAKVDEDPWAGVEEMVVTGGNVLDALTSTTVSVTAFDSTDLDAFGATDVSDVAAFTPNLEIRTAGSTTAVLFIRGVGLNDFTANAAGSVAVYEDDVPKNLPAIQLGQLYDLEGLVVLKGPQGSGPGRNASAGAIKVITKKPSGELGGYVRFDYGNYNYINSEGALEVPILGDVLSTRAAFSLERRDGLVKNRCAGITQEQIDTVVGLCGNNFPDDLIPGVEDDLNNRDVWAVRLTTRWEPPIDDMSWLFSVHGSQLDQLGTVGEHIGSSQEFGGTDIVGYVQPELAAERASLRSQFPSRAECNAMNPGDIAGRRACVAAAQASTRSILGRSLASRPLDTEPFEGAFNRPGYERMSSWGGFLTGEWELDDVQLKSITGFERYDRERLIDADYSPNVVFEFDIEDDAWQASQDIQISGELEETPLIWKTGLFFLAETLDYEQDTLSREPGDFDPTRSTYIQDTFSFGIFAEFEWDFLDDFTLEAGGRYNWEQKRFEADIISRPFAANPGDRCILLIGDGVPKCQRTVTVDHPTGTLGIRYALDESRTLYFKYSHGWKGAQFNARNGNSQLFVTDVADPEVIDAFEIGFSGSWWEDRLSLNGAFFWYIYKNYQVFVFTNDVNNLPQRVVINADNAELYGAELEGRLEPFDGLVAELRAGWLESRFLDFTDAVVRRTETQGNRRVVTDFNGNPLPNAPRFKVSGNISYDLDLGSYGTLTPRYDFNWSDDVFFDPTGGTGSPDAVGNTFLPDNSIGQKALILHNIRLTYAVESGGFEIAGWVRNMTNEVYKTLAFDASAGPGLVGNLVGDPRTYGLSAKVTF